MSLSMTRRAAVALGAAAIATPAAFGRAPHKTERWGLYEVVLKGPTGGNPFIDVSLTAAFESGGTSLTVTGFYDGDGVYRIRFMPDRVGQWTYRTKSNRTELDGKTGTFEAVPPTGKNHGPVGVTNTFHFAYADGTPHYSLGTTSYAWAVQAKPLRDLTLKSLAAAPFNKMRMAVFSNADVADDPLYPFEGTPPHGWDFTRFNPAYFRRYEECVARLATMGIEADVILFHPYDRGRNGFDAMPAEVDDRYVRYVVARLAAHRNVWWSLANEFDDMKHKTDADFDRLFQVVRDSDPYGHLRSVHNNKRMYNLNQPWVTHASIQNGGALEDDARAVLYREVYRKPVVMDEICYEGNIGQRWGDLTAEHLVKRFWYGAVAGVYVGHGEVIGGDDKRVWTGQGGLLKGQSAPRLAFFRKLMEECPPTDPIDHYFEGHIGGVPGQYYLRYFGDQSPKEWEFSLPKAELADGQTFAVEVIDTWNMTVTPVPGPFKIRKSGDYAFAADRTVPLPGKPYIALRIRKA